MRSSHSRRQRIDASAGGDGSRPTAGSLARTKASIGWAAGGDTSGTGGRFGLTKAQWGAYGAPASIHRSSSALWASVRGFWVSGGGMTVVASVERIRWTTRLSAPFPGTIAVGPESPPARAPSRVSRRRPACRDAPSAPWQVEQCSARIGWISRSKSGAGSSAGSVPAARQKRIRLFKAIRKRSMATEKNSGAGRRQMSPERITPS